MPQQLALQSDTEPKGKNQAFLTTQTQQHLPSSKFTKVEKNLASLGFFTPSSKRVRDVKAKTINFTRVDDRRKIEVQATIVPSTIYGLPVTADQDKYLALQKLITDTQQRQGSVSNPVAFTSAELLKVLQQNRNSGKNYKEISDWLDLMASTTIISQGVVYLAGRKRWARDRFRVFDRAISLGQELPDGGVADKNYVWLSEWQLENINNNHLLPIDLETYRKLKNHIAKALVPLLQIWLYASRQEGSFTKRYEEICQILQIRQYKRRSDIRRKFGTSLDELKSHGYLADWKIERTRDRKNYKVVLYHGEKFHRDRRSRLSQKDQAVPIPATAQVPSLNNDETKSPVATELLEELKTRGVSERQAEKVLVNLAPRQLVMDQLEWGDHQLAVAEPGKIKNPPGFYISLLRDNIQPPQSFESTRKRKQREQAEHKAKEKQERQALLKREYEAYREQELDRYIAAHSAEHRRLIRETKVQLLREIKRSHPHAKDKEQWAAEVAQSRARDTIAERLPLLSLDEFSERRGREGK